MWIRRLIAASDTGFQFPSAGFLPPLGISRSGSMASVTGVRRMPRSGSNDSERALTTPIWKPRSRTGEPTSRSPTGSVNSTS